MNEVVTVKADDFTGTVKHEGSVLTARLQGTADYAALDALESMLERLHAEAQMRAVSEAVVDLTTLEFMNSSCFKSFVSWINQIQELDGPRQYKVRFMSNPNMHWQKRSLHSLRCFAVELITISE